MVTLKDIAAASGVSNATVSYVMNRCENVKISEETRKKVLAAAKRLGYRPNALARSVRSGCSNVIALVSSTGIGSDYFYNIFNSICRTATKHDFAVKIYFLENDPASALKMLLEQRVAGVIFHAADFGTCAWLAQELQKRSVPVAAVNCRAAVPNCPSFASDDRRGAYDAVKYLAASGRRKIVCLTHPGHYDYIRLRREGYSDAMKEFLPSVKPMFQEISTYAYKNPDDPLRLLLRGKQRPDGVFCIADGHAMHLFQIAYAEKIRIPEELAVIGFGNLAGSVDAMVPLTTVAQGFEEMGHLAADGMIRAIRRKQMMKDEVVEIPASLLIRESV